MPRPLLLLAALAVLAAPGRAQIDLPDRPVRPAGPTRPVRLPPVQRGDLAEKVRGDAPTEPVGPVLPDAGPTAATEGTETAPAATPASALATAARFILDEVRKARSVDDRVVQQAVASLASLGDEGRAVVLEALPGDHAPTLVVAARVLLGGSAEDAERVVERIRGRLPNAACAPLVQALAEVDPVRAPPQLLAELLDHPQGAMRVAAQRQLGQLPPASMVEALPPALEARRADTRLRAVQLLAVCPDPRALELLLSRLADPSAEVAGRVVEACAALPDERVVGELLRRAFDGRWFLRDQAYAVLALVEREDLRLEGLIGPQHVDALLGGLSSSDAFVSGASAAALAGIGFRSEAGATAPWLDSRVPERLVLAVSGREFHNDFSALQPAAMRRLALISGEAFGTDGPRWVAWWVEAAPDFRARRASLPIEPDQADALRLDLLSTVAGERSFRLVGPARDAAAGVPPVPRTLVLTSAQAGELLEVLRREGVLAPERLPGTRGAGGSARTLEVARGSDSKVFRFSEERVEPWFQRVVATAQALAVRNRWQLYPRPGEEADARAAFEREHEWWEGERTPLERDLRLKERVLGALPARRPSQRDEGLEELAQLSQREGRFGPEDVSALLELLTDEPFLGPRARTLVDLLLLAARPSPDAPLPPEEGARLVAALHDGFGLGAVGELERVLEAQGGEALRAAARDGRPLLRVVAAAPLAREPGAEELALLRELLGDPEPQVELAAVRAVGTGRVEALRTEVLVRARVAEGELRAAALEATGRLGGENALDALLIGLSETDLVVAEGAARGLAELADPSTAPLLVSLLGRSGEDDPLVAPARRGLLSLGERAWPDLLRVVNSPGGGAGRREAALLLAVQGVPQAAPALMRALDADPRDARVAAELCVLTGVDLRGRPDPAAAWWGWWTGVVHDDSLAWFLAALELEGLPTPDAASLAGAGSAEGAAFLASVLSLAPPHLAERARRELGRILGRDLGELPPPGPQLDARLEELQVEIGQRAW